MSQYVELDPLFNLFKIKYAKLDELITKHCTEIGPTSRVNLFINLEPIIRKLTASNVDEYLRVKNKEKSYELISNIINLASHYRMFFTKSKLYSKVYMYVNYPFRSQYKNRMLNSKYRKDYEQKFTDNPKAMVLSHTMDNIIPFIKIILEYVEGVYLIPSGAVEASVVPQVINKEYPNTHLNLLVSTDRYDYQYVNQGFYILRPKKDQSYIVSPQNAVEIMKLEDKVVDPTLVGNNFIPFILSVLGDKNRSIPKLKRVGIAGIVTMLHKAIEDNIIGPDVRNINILSQIIKDEYRAQVMTNFYTTDIESQVQALNVRDIHMIKEHIVDKFDNVSLKKMNDEYFHGYPIQLMELTEATELLTTRRKKSIFD